MTVRNCHRWLLVSLLVVLPTLSPLAQPPPLTGTVLGPDGQPAAGARVVGLVLGMDYSPRLIETTSDAAGAFSLTPPATPVPSGIVQLVALKDGYALGWWQSHPMDGEPAARPPVLRLGANPATRMGLVTTTEGRPVAGATVSLFALTGPDVRRAEAFLGWAPMVSCRTDAQGRFTLGGLPAGRAVMLQVEAEGLAWGFLSDDRLVEGNTVRLAPEATISGRVTGDGQPLAGVRLNCFSADTWPRSAATGPDGTYEFRHLGPGPAGIRLQAPAGFADPGGRSLKLKLGEHLTGVDFALTAGVAIRGRVTMKAGGQPVAEAHLRAEGISGDSPRMADATTDATGRYELHVTPGRYRLWCYMFGRTAAPGAEPEVAVRQTVTAEMTVKATDRAVTHDFALPPPTPPRRIDGVVLLPNGRPDPQATVTVSRHGGRLDTPLPVKPDGHFELVLAGDANMQDKPTFLARDTSRQLIGLAAADERQNKITLRLQAPAWFTIATQDEQGGPLAQIPFTVGSLTDWYGPLQLQQAATDATGRVRLGPLPAGVALSVSVGGDFAPLIVRPEQWKQMKPLTLAPGEVRRLPTLTVNPQGRTLPVCVVDAQRRPVPGVTVYARWDRSATTDANGCAELTRLPLTGAVEVIAVELARDLSVYAKLDPTPGQRQELVILPPGEATGVVRDQQGRPAAGLDVDCGPMQVEGLLRFLIKDGHLNDPLPDRVTTDRDGRWHATGLLPGLTYLARVSFNPEDRAWLAASEEFVARGGPGVQDTGVVTLNRRPTAKP